jgi:hypothetical protein
MSAVGRATIFAAEAALWIAGAAIVAGVAGGHWNIDVPIDMSSLTGDAPAPTASPSASATPTLVIQTLAPGASPTVSPLVAKYQAYAARTDTQLTGKFVETASFTLSGNPHEMTISGTIRSKGGAQTTNQRETVDGAVHTRDMVSIGGTDYESVDGNAWTKTATPSTSGSMANPPATLLLEHGVETKNGLQLHRLDAADPVAFSKEMVKQTTGATDAQVTATIWVDDDGAPQALRMEGWFVMPLSGVSTKMTFAYDLRVVAHTDFTITAPI